MPRTRITSRNRSRSLDSHACYDYYYEQVKKKLIKGVGYKLLNVPAVERNLNTGKVTNSTGHIQCPNCDYAWLPRVTKPKECPNCKRRLK